MSIECRGRQQKTDDARDALRLVQQVIEHPRSSDPTLERITALTAQHLGCDEYQAASLLENAGIQEPLRIHLTDQRVKRFVRACRTHLQLTPLPEGFHQDKPRPATSTQRAAAAVLASFLQQLDADPQARLSLPYLTAQLSNALTYRHRHTAILLERASIVDPLNLSLRSWSTGRFLQTVISSPAHYPPPVPVTDLDQYRNPDTESPDGYGKKRKKTAKAPATTAALASSFPQRETPQQQGERLEREPKERARHHLQRATPRARTKTAPPANPVANKTAARLAQARGLLKAASRQHVSPATMTRRPEVLVRDLANTLALPPSAVQELITSTRLTLSSSGLAEDRITAFLDAVQAHPVYAQPVATKTAPVTAALPVTVPGIRSPAALAACRGVGGRQRLGRAGEADR